MANVHLLKACTNDAVYDRLKASYHISFSPRHTLVDSPKQADIVVFAGSDYGNLVDIRRHPIFRKYSDNAFVLFEGDWCLPIVPGLYSGLDRWGVIKRWCEPLHYTKVAFYDDLDSVPDTHPDLLCSFVGRKSTSSVRQQLRDVNDGTCYISESPPRETSAYRTAYVEMIGRSRFVLCPRGLGVSSIRLYETLRSGRVPVIISDDWVPPAGPDWASCSVRIPEANAKHAVNVLDSLDTRWPAMSRAARMVYSDWFSRQSQFDRIIDWCLNLSRGPDRALWPGCIQHLQRLRPSFIKRSVKSRVGRLLQ